MILRCSAKGSTRKISVLSDGAPNTAVFFMPAALFHHLELEKSKSRNELGDRRDDAGRRISINLEVLNENSSLLCCGKAQPCWSLLVFLHFEQTKDLYVCGESLGMFILPSPSDKIEE